MNQCPDHHLPWKTVPAGISPRTGQPYNSFLTCPVQGCRQKPPRNGPQGPQVAPGAAIGTSPGSDAILELAAAIRYLADKLPEKSAEWPA